MREYEKKYGRTPNSVRLLAVSKGQSAEKIKLAYAAGQRCFGENYLQEALEKIDDISRHCDETIEWHFIGHLQSNKTRKIAEHFAWAHSVCDKNIAKRLNDQRPAHLPPLSICIQVNISHEASKSGTGSDQVLALAEYCTSLPNLRLRGLMAIPAIKNHLAEQRAEYNKLRSIYEWLQQRGLELDTLSMGMSNDMEAAIAEKSNLIRIGAAIFGERIP
ncbi:MAG: YggS family pyridoxal phosphate enzyme [Gammaproteobacteria bacterium RIFCSPHIGHO2_12_FULL_37_14]|nr:MAG: YggS family pyridoxal phosphate enzyme [Gammaproteobacteria bacterium RIFCSPHIGHO2_12_FULL_37_14]